MGNRVAVIGAGSWGTALAILLANKGCNVSIWEEKRTIRNNDRNP